MPRDDEDEELCTVCCHTLNDDACSTVTLDCGHTFHSTCAILWFRTGGSSCPNCRADEVQTMWRVRNRTEIIAAIRRARQRAGGIPLHVEKMLDEFDAAIKKQKDLRDQTRAFRREHAKVFRDFALLTSRLNKSVHKERELRHRLLHTPVPDVARLVRTRRR